MGLPEFFFLFFFLFFLPPGWFPDNILRTPVRIDLKFGMPLTWVIGKRPIDFGPDRVINY